MDSLNLKPLVEAYGVTGLILIGLVAGGVGMTIWTAASWYRLSHVPGPLAASLTGFWAYRASMSGHYADIVRDIQEKYGKVARIAPNDVMISDPDTLWRMSSARSVYGRGGWYASIRFNPYGESVFSEMDTTKHDKRKSKLIFGFSGKGLMDIESNVDAQIAILVDVLKQKIAGGGGHAVIDFGRMLQNFQVDLITLSGMGKAWGNLATDKDHFDYLKSGDETFAFIQSAAMVPSLRNIMFSPLWLRLTGSDPTAGWLGSLKQAVARQISDDTDEKSHDTMLAEWLKHKMSPTEAELDLSVQLPAGTETSINTIRGVLLYLMTTPRIHQKLRKEISDGIRDGRISKPMTGDEAKNLPYLQAVINEGLRVANPVIAGFPKKVPPGGDVVCGKKLPGGTDVHVNFQSLMRDREVFGDDVDIFRPERFIEADDETLARRRKVVDLLFGFGRWLCLGRVLALLELNKIFVELLREFDFQVANPEKPWKRESAATVFIHDFVQLTLLEEKPSRPLRAFPTLLFDIPFFTATANCRLDADSAIMKNSNSDQDLKKALGGLLDDIRVAGDFAVFKSLSVFTNPGPQVNDTPIALPLQPRDADLLKAACRRAPFGRGAETVVDDSVRKTWELDHSQFKLANPAWSDFLEKVAKETADSLGMVDVRAEPYKLLLYEEGSFFRRHKDSEKMKGMIGTLVISLPSHHEGGDVHLSLGQQSRSFSTSPTSAYNLGALAWYSDVTHEITQLTSGYRLVLTYNIVQQGLKNPSAADLISKQSEIGELLQGSEKQWLYYPLGHQYTEASLSLKNMKGRDRAVCRTLDVVLRKHGYFLLLAKLTKIEEGYKYDEWDMDTTFELQSVQTPNGQKIVSHFDVDPEDIIGFNMVYGDNRGADSEDEEEFTGNEGIPLTHRYHDWVAMIVPKKVSHRLLNGDSPRTAVLLDMVIEDLRLHIDDKNTRETAATFMDELLATYGQHTSQSGFVDESGSRRGSAIKGVTLATIAEWAVHLGRNDVYQKCVQQAMLRRDCHPLVELVARFVNAPPPGTDFIGWDTWLSAFVTNVTDVAWLETVLSSLKSLIQSDSLLESFATWQATLLPRQLDSRTSFGLRDRSFLDQIIERLVTSSESTMLRDSLMKAMAERADKHLLYRLLVDLLRKRSDGSASGEEYRDIGHLIIQKTESKLVLDMPDFNYRLEGLSLWNFPKSPTQSSTEMGHSDYFLKLIEMCLEHGYHTIVVDLVESTGHKMLQDRDSWPLIQSVELETVYDFLVQACTVFTANEMPFPPSFGLLWEALFQKYVWNQLPAPPQQLVGLAHRPRGCPSSSCADCRKLDTFLRSETEQVFKLQAAQRQRDHVTARLEQGTFGILTNRNSRQGKSHVLVVTKVPGKEHAEDKKVYEKQLSEIRLRLQRFKQDEVQQAIGDDLYSKLVLLDEGSGTTDASVAGQKRKILGVQEMLGTQPEPKMQSKKL